MSSLLLVLLLGCERGGSLDLNVTDPDKPADVGAIRLTAPPAFDPVLGGPVSIDVVVEVITATPTLEVYDAAGALVRPLDAADPLWDGRDAAGLFVPGGRYTVRA
ncbi:MAG: FlgD Ig-like domain, partial [Pseudomonadota bacterium]